MFERGPEYASEVIRYINVIKLLKYADVHDNIKNSQ